MSSRAPSGPIRATALAFTPLLVLAGAAVVARLRGARVGLILVLPAAGWLLLSAMVAAACASHAFLGRRWWWGVGLLALWPLTVPAYLWLRSAEADV